MRLIYSMLAVVLVLVSCKRDKEISSISAVNWDKRTVQHELSDTLEFGRTYLSVYSEIYGQTEHFTYPLTATISMRNASLTDSIYVLLAEYFDTHGKPIRIYFDKPIFVMPMETVEIIIDEKDREGGTGGNFLFDWKKAKHAPDPIFEGVMISMTGQQGLSFTTQGKRVE
jgi:hypothetical protein